VLSEVIAVVLAVLNGVLALYLLKQAKILLKTEPLWLNDFVEDKKISLMESLVEENSEGASFLDAVAQKFGQSLRMGLLAQKSGAVRHNKMIENRVFEAVKGQSPELNLILKALDKFGLGDLATPENLPALLGMAQKYGLFGNFLKKPSPNNPRGTSDGDLTFGEI